MIMIISNAVLIVLAIIFMRHNAAIYEKTKDETAKKRFKIFAVAVILSVIFFFISIVQYIYIVDMIRRFAS